MLDTRTTIRNVQDLRFDLRVLLEGIRALEQDDTLVTLKWADGSVDKVPSYGMLIKYLGSAFRTLQVGAPTATFTSDEGLHIDGKLAAKILSLVEASLMFRDCKIVYTPSAVPFKANMPKNLVGILSHRGATMDALAKVELCTMADFERIGVYFSDVVAPFVPSAELLEFAEKHKKIIMPAPGEGDSWASHFVSFINDVWEESHPDKNDDDD